MNCYIINLKIYSQVSQNYSKINLHSKDSAKYEQSKLRGEKNENEVGIEARRTRGEEYTYSSTQRERERESRHGV